MDKRLLAFVVGGKKSGVVLVADGCDGIDAEDFVLLIHCHTPNIPQTVDWNRTSITVFVVVAMMM